MIKVYNSLTRQKEKFAPLKGKSVGMYVCGPTVYGPSHLGHARTYINFDFIRRFLEFQKYKIKFVMNITDVHDDILKQARELKIQPQKLAQQYSQEFFDDLKTLKIKKAFRYPRVSQHIKEIIKIIKILLKKGYAYQTEDGVYFRISSFKNYGQLSTRKLNEAMSGTRIKTDKYEKEEIADFALWKKTQVDTDLKPNSLRRTTQTNTGNFPRESVFSLRQSALLLFDSPWGGGRPGWHIECSAMSKKYLGIPFDIHGGAMDLIFPHHENEIAQSESAFAKKFVNYFLHAGLLYVQGKKMSKSLKNFITIDQFLRTPATKQILAIDFQPTARFLRFFVLTHRWRSVIDLNQKTLTDAWNNYFAINEFIAKINVKPQISRDELKSLSQDSKSPRQSAFSLRESVVKILEDDFNSARAINYLLEFINKLNTDLHGFNTQIYTDILKTLKELDEFFVCLFPWIKIDVKTKNLIKERENLRKQKNFNEADKLREQLKNQGIILEDLKGQTLIINLN